MSERLTQNNNREIEYFNSVFIKKENSIWKLKTLDGEVDLPEDLGRHLYFSLKLVIKYLHERHYKMQENKDTDHLPDPTSEDMFAKAVGSFDCFAFVARCVGWELPVKYLRKPAYTSHLQLFKTEHFEKLPTQQKLLDYINEHMDLLNSNIFVGQIYNDEEKYVTHTFLVIRIGGVLYNLSKNGRQGIVSIERLSEEYKDNLPNVNRSAFIYGDRFAFATYEKLAKMPKLIDYYKKPHFYE